MRSARLLAIAIAVAPTAAWAQTPERCPLRVALVQGNAAQATRDANGTYRGVSVDIASDIARRWGRRLSVTAMTPQQILAAIGRREIDLGFVAANPDRGGAITYTRPYMLVQQTAMVTAGSAVQSVRELDRPGVTIGANTGDSVAGYLTRTLTKATVTTSGDITLAEAATWLGDGTVAAFAGNRQRLGVAARTRGNLRLLPDNFYAVPQAVAVATGDPATLAALQHALDDLQRRSRIARMIRRSGVIGVDPAPAAGRPTASPAAPVHTRC